MLSTEDSTRPWYSVIKIVIVLSTKDSNWPTYSVIMHYTLE